MFASQGKSGPGIRKKQLDNQKPKLRFKTRGMKGNQESSIYDFELMPIWARKNFKDKKSLEKAFEEFQQGRIQAGYPRFIGGIKEWMEMETAMQDADEAWRLLNRDEKRSYLWEASVEKGSLNDALKIPFENYNPELQKRIQELMVSGKHIPRFIPEKHTS